MMLNIKEKIKHLIRSVIDNPTRAVELTYYKERKVVLQNNILFCKESGISEEKYTDCDIIVSLTTYGKRIHDVALTIESIMEQTMKANRIILWLDFSFQNKTLPRSLQLLQKRGLEVEYCKDIRSYTKLVPSLLKYPNDIIITIDDDVIYEYDLLEHLIMAYQKEPSFVYCHRSHKMLKDNKGNLKSYMKWEWCAKSTEPRYDLFPTGVGGVLYPPKCLDDEVLNEEVFTKICPTADDVWFKAMALKKGTKACSVFSHDEYGEEYVLNPDVQDVGLSCINNGEENMNDVQIKAVFNKYKLSI